MHGHAWCRRDWSGLSRQQFFHQRLTNEIQIKCSWMRYNLIQAIHSLSSHHHCLPKPHSWARLNMCRQIHKYNAICTNALIHPHITIGFRGLILGHGWICVDKYMNKMQYALTHSFTLTPPMASKAPLPSTASAELTHTQKARIICTQVLPLHSLTLTPPLSSEAPLPSTAGSVHRSPRSSLAARSPPICIVAAPTSSSTSLPATMAPENRH